MTHPWNLKDLPRTVLAVLFIALMIIASFWIITPFIPALIWSTLIVVATWPLMLKVQRRLWGKRSLAVIVMTAVLLLVVIVPLALAAMALIENADEVGEKLTVLAHASLPAPPAWVERLPMVGQKIAADWQALASLGADELHARVLPYAKDGARWVLSKAGGLAAFFVHLLITVIISALFYSQGEVAADGVRAFARRLVGARGEKSITLAGQSIRAVALGVVVTAFVQALLGGIGLAVAGVPLPGLLTALMFVLAVAQIGAGPVLIIAVIWLYSNGDSTTATMFLVWSIFVSTIDNVIRPFLIKSGADLPLVLIFAGVIGGLLAFGVVGLFVGPVVLAVAYTELVAWVKDGEAAGDSPS